MVELPNERLDSMRRSRGKQGSSAGEAAAGGRASLPDGCALSQPQCDIMTDLPSSDRPIKLTTVVPPLPPVALALPGWNRSVALPPICWQPCKVSLTWQLAEADCNPFSPSYQSWELIGWNNLPRNMKARKWSTWQANLVTILFCVPQARSLLFDNLMEVLNLPAFLVTGWDWGAGSRTKSTGLVKLSFQPWEIGFQFVRVRFEAAKGLPHVRPTWVDISKAWQALDSTAPVSPNLLVIAPCNIRFQFGMFPVRTPQVKTLFPYYHRFY